MKAEVHYLDGSVEEFSNVEVFFQNAVVRIAEFRSYGYAPTTTIPLTSIKKVVTS